MNDGQCGLVFVHGINNGPKERPTILPKMEAALRRFGVFNLFTMIRVAEWRSLGDFMLDLAELCNPANEVRRNEAVSDVALTIAGTIEKLIESATEKNPPDSMFPRLLVVGHSMGQVISRLAIDELGRKWKHAPIPISLLTLGGPIGNPSPLVQDGLHWVPRHCKSNDPPANYLVEWCDGVNNDDPIPCEFPTRRHRDIPGVRTFNVDFPGRPLPWNPLGEHSSYFDTPHAFDQVSAMVKALTDVSRHWASSL